MMGRSKKPAEPEKGIRCPKCNCGDLRVLYTRKAKRGIRRVRRCRFCGRRISSIERAT